MSGAIDVTNLKQFMEKLGQAKTHLELKKMIQEVDTGKTGTISYKDFVEMKFGRKNSVLKIILRFEDTKTQMRSAQGMSRKL